MSFLSNFNSRMLHLDQSSEVTNYRWVRFEKIWKDGQRIGMLMCKRVAPHEKLAEVFIDGTIITYPTFSNLENRTRRSIRESIQAIAILISEEDNNAWYSKRIYQRKVEYNQVRQRSNEDFGDFLCKKYRVGEPNAVAH